VYAPVTGEWSFTSAPKQVRSSHTATLLPSGKVLVVGGYNVDLVEVYDPATGEWSFTGSLKQTRSSHTATLLLNGKVLVVGGYNVAPAEVYDPATGEWSFTGSLQQVRYGHTATLLPDGKVLVVGGQYEDVSLASAEVYDPTTGAWSFTGSLKQARSSHTATLLPDGKVLVVGGNINGNTPLLSAEIYDPVSGDWSSARSMKRARVFHTATLLPDGKVLVVGGADGTRSPLAFTEVYDPDNRAWSSAASLTLSRQAHTATLLPGGKILVAGGMGSFFSTPPSELYNPTTETWSSAASLAQDRQSHTATLLSGGKVLVVGGAEFISGDELSSAELYMDSAGAERWRPRLTDVSPTQLEQGSSITVTGELFQGSSEAGSGTTQSSPTNYPLLSLSSVETGRWMPLLGHDFSDTSVSATLPFILNGYYLLNVTTQGLTSSRVISIINSTPPDTSLKAESPEQVTQSTTATFSFSSASSHSFECNLDGLAFTHCTSPLRYSLLPEGKHIFLVRARDLDGTVDPTPATHSWTVDRTKPETVIDAASTPLAFSQLTSARFSFSSEEGSSFVCSLDGAAFTDCSNSCDYANLADGEHTFQVRATDRAGNQELTAAEYQWTVDTVPPRGAELQVPTPHQQLFTSRPVFSGTAEPGSTVRVFVDGNQVGEVQANEGGYWELTSQPLAWRAHTATVTATDPAGNISEPSLEVSFATVQHGYYGMSCAAAPSVGSSWPWALMALGLLRRRRSH
jgi:uncharacterized protein (TIGR03382 family)